MLNINLHFTTQFPLTPHTNRIKILLLVLQLLSIKENT